MNIILSSLYIGCLDLLEAVILCIIIAVLATSAIQVFKMIRRKLK